MGLPLPTLLSQAVVAFTIEADHLFEGRMPHCTSESRQRGEPVVGPWLISMPFWANCLAHVEAEGMSVDALVERAPIADRYLRGSNPGLVRWGYLQLSLGVTSPRKLDGSWTVVPTPGGLRAQATWATIPDEVDGRWVARWPAVTALRDLLAELVVAADRDLPGHLPVNGGHDGWVTLPRRPPRAVADLDVGTLLAKALLLLTLEVETTSPVALVHTANVLRVLDRGPVAQRDLPRVTGVAKETLAVMTGLLRKQELVTVSASKEVAITAAGRGAAEAAGVAVAAVEAGWPPELRDLLESLVGDGTVDGSALAEAIHPPDGTWRSRRPRPQTLPHHPVISHRGGYPDGS